MFIKVQFYLEPCIMVEAKSDVWPKIFIFTLYLHIMAILVL